ncbi:MAG: AraC family transcriptional regulator [Clostridia bacterium]|nr:AraC family transcriptional regulator [Clostridia bacterium]
MTIQELAALVEANIVTASVDTGREVECGYTCDLLSWVMANGSEGMAWITVQTHMNVIAVATLHDMSCVIIPEGIKVEDDVIGKADEEGVAILTTSLGAYEICGRMNAKGIPAK